jgi:hypothetical protein
MTTITWPTLTVEISFDSDSVKAFVQRDLATTATWTNVTAYMLGFGYQRGRQRQLGRSEAGTGYLILDNADGRFDPENSSSPYYGDYGTGTGEGMRPGKHVRVRATWSGTTYNLFYMFVTAWPPTELSRRGTPIVRVALADHIAWFARAMANFVTPDALAPWQAIEDLLLGEDIPASGMLLDTSGIAAQTALSEIDEVGSNPWSAVQSCADSEESALIFINGAGQYTYHDHARRYVHDRSTVVQAVFDNGSSAPAGAVPYTEVTYTRDTNDLYARFDVTPAGLSTQSTTAAALSSRYYTRALSRATRHKFEAQSLRLAQRLRDRTIALWQDHGLAQHTTLTVEAGIGVSALWPKVLGLEISDLIRVTERLYPGGRQRTIPSFVEGMQVDVDRERESWKVTYRLSRALSAYHWIIEGKGTAFPPSPADGDLFYRTDVNLLCYYDGVRWLTVTEYEATPTHNTAQPYSIAQTVGIYPEHPLYTRYVTGLIVSLAVLTTNNGLNYWAIRLIRMDTGAAVSSDIVSMAAPVGTWANSSLSTTLLATYPIGVAVAKVGAPGNLFVTPTIRYRLIIP